MRKTITAAALATTLGLAATPAAAEIPTGFSIGAQFGVPVNSVPERFDQPKIGEEHTAEVDSLAATVANSIGGSAEFDITAKYTALIGNIIVGGGIQLGMSNNYLVPATTSINGNNIDVGLFGTAGYAINDTIALFAKLGMQSNSQYFNGFTVTDTSPINMSPFVGVGATFFVNNNIGLTIGGDLNLGNNLLNLNTVSTQDVQQVVCLSCPTTTGKIYVGLDVFLDL